MPSRGSSPLVRGRERFVSVLPRADPFLKGLPDRTRPMKTTALPPGGVVDLLKGRPESYCATVHDNLWGGYLMGVYAHHHHEG